MPLGPCFLSPIVDVRYVLPRFDKDPVQHIQRLRDLVLRYRIDSIIPGSDADVALLSLYRDVLADTSARFLVPSHASVEIANDKCKTYQFAAANDIPQPLYVIIDPSNPDTGALDRLAGKLMVVKDRTTYTSIVPNSRAAVEIAVWIGDLLGESVVVQEYIPGREISTLSLVDAGGCILQTIALCKLLTDKDGETREAITVDAPEVIALSERIIGLLGWIGPIEVEWRVSAETGRPLLQEINSRFPAWVYITCATGTNLVWAYRQLLLDKDPGPLPPYRRGVAFSRIPHDCVVAMDPF